MKKRCLGSRSEKAIDYTVRMCGTYSIRLHNYPHDKNGLVTCINPLSLISHMTPIHRIFVIMLNRLSALTTMNRCVSDSADISHRLHPSIYRETKGGLPPHATHVASDTPAFVT
jgi:hypothetical protein